MKFYTLKAKSYLGVMTSVSCGRFLEDVINEIQKLSNETYKGKPRWIGFEIYLEN